MAKRYEKIEHLEDTLKQMNLPQEKVTEFINEDVDVVKLSLDDLDGISGGGVYAVDGHYAPEDWRCGAFCDMTWPEGGDFINALYENFGRDVTIDFCKSAFCLTNDWAEYFNPPGLTAYYCALMMWSLAWRAHGCKP